MAVDCTREVQGKQTKTKKTNKQTKKNIARRIYVHPGVLNFIVTQAISQSTLQIIPEVTCNGFLSWTINCINVRLGKKPSFFTVLLPGFQWPRIHGGATRLRRDRRCFQCWLRCIVY